MTIAPESVDPARIRRLVAAGVVVSVGHSDAGRTAVTAAADAGATLITHLFNAMSQIGNREPGVAGVALDEGRLHAGLIADGIHVDPATIGIALRAKRPPGHVFLVTDAMATIGTELTEFTLNGRRIKREAGSLRLEDGTLAGADLDMISAVRFIHGLGLPLEEALRMASLYPAAALGVAARYGHLGAGARADFVCLGEGLSVDAVWIARQPRILSLISSFDFEDFMKTIFSPLHAGHGGQTELIAGEIVPGFEKPARAEIIKARVIEAQLGPVLAPEDHDLAAAHRVHATDYVAFLPTVWPRWSAAGNRDPQCALPGRRAVCAATSCPRRIEAAAGLLFLRRRRQLRRRHLGGDQIVL